MSGLGEMKRLPNPVQSVTNQGEVAGEEVAEVGEAAGEVSALYPLWEGPARA